MEGAEVFIDDNSCGTIELANALPGNGAEQMVSLRCTY
jgi:hypothetical protein